MRLRGLRRILRRRDVERGAGVFFAGDGLDRGNGGWGGVHDPMLGPPGCPGRRTKVHSLKDIIMPLS